MKRLEGARRIRGQLKSNHQIPDVGAGGTQVHQIAARRERGRGIRPLEAALRVELRERDPRASVGVHEGARVLGDAVAPVGAGGSDGVTEDAGYRKSTRLNSSHEWISYAVFCLKK